VLQSIRWDTMLDSAGSRGQGTLRLHISPDRQNPAKNTERMPFNVLRSLSRAFERVVTGNRERDAMSAWIGTHFGVGSDSTRY
jgi:hypothetical protein